ncbi:LemA family protein [Candidatus Acetothermia bacterium]|nr:MAG: LemA family protein [Candidatus Acetothermia bacterium]
MRAGIALGALVVIILLWGVFSYNRLVRLRVRAEESWRDIDTQLKRRWDLIPNLVEAVKGYAAHEKGVFERVTEARARALDAKGPREQAEAEEGLKNALFSLFAVAENYPQLRANENFLELQRTLEEAEDAIQRSRRYYNAVVRELNTNILTFPRSIIAAIFHFKEREFYMLPDEEERQAPQVRF